MSIPDRPNPLTTGTTGLSTSPAQTKTEDTSNPARHIPAGEGHAPDKKLHERQPGIAVNLPPQMSGAEKQTVIKICEQLEHCANRQAQLEGQKYLHSQLDQLTQQLDNPQAANVPAGYRLMYVVKGKPPVSVIPPEQGGADVTAKVNALRQKAKPFLQETRAYFSDQRVQELDRKLQYVAQKTEQLLTQLKDLNTEASVPKLLPMPVKLNARELHAELGSGLPLPAGLPERNPDDPAFTVMPKPAGSPQPSETPKPVTTPKPVPKAMDESKRTEQWLAFINKGGKIDGQKFTLEQIRKLTFEKMETEHSYIQLLFPNEHQSRNNPTAPLLTPTMIAQIQQSQELSAELEKSVDQMLTFWGLKRKGDHIEVDQTLRIQHGKWNGAFDHNHQRITRVLDCLMACGYVSCACSLEDALQSERRRLNQPLIPHWSKAVEKDSGLQREFFSKTVDDARLNVRSYKDYQARYPFRHYQHDVGNIVGFYDRGAPFYSFTNFFQPDSPIVIDGQYWTTTEHYFQASKFKVNSEEWKAIKNCRTPGEAFQYLRTPKPPSNQPPTPHFADWHGSRKNIVMMNALRAKAECCDQFKRELLSTGNKPLFETSQTDWYWGVATNPADQSDGQNHLGAMLMQLRDELRAEEQLDIG